MNMNKIDKSEIAKHVKEILKIAAKNRIYLSIQVIAEDDTPSAHISDVPRKYYGDLEYVRLSKSETKKCRQKEKPTANGLNKTI